jgi:hypothetical protein
MLRPAAALGLAASLAACATTPTLPPTEVVRYHLGAPIARGTVAVEPLAGGAPASLEFKSYAAAVESELLRIGYASPPAGARAEYVATVDFRRSTVEGPPRRSPVSIGIGGGGYSGGYRGGGLGLGGGVSFPVGGGRRGREVLVTELRVLIKRRADQQQLWDGSARAITDIRAADATADGQGRKLAAALFTGFPGESGRTIEVR